MIFFAGDAPSVIEALWQLLGGAALPFSHLTTAAGRNLLVLS
jgi:hypothetical protein